MVYARPRLSACYGRAHAARSIGNQRVTNSKGTLTSIGPLATFWGIGGKGAARSSAATAASSSTVEPELFSTARETRLPSGLTVKRIMTVPAWRERGLTFARSIDFDSVPR